VAPKIVFRHIYLNSKLSHLRDKVIGIPQPKLYLYSKSYELISDHFSGPVVQSVRCVTVCLRVRTITVERNDL